MEEELAFGRKTFLGLGEVGCLYSRSKPCHVNTISLVDLLEIKLGFGTQIPSDLGVSLHPLSVREVPHIDERVRALCPYEEMEVPIAVTSVVSPPIVGSLYFCPAGLRPLRLGIVDLCS